MTDPDYDYTDQGPPEDSAEFMAELGAAIDKITENFRALNVQLDELRAELAESRRNVAKINEDIERVLSSLTSPLPKGGHGPD